MPGTGTEAGLVLCCIAASVGWCWAGILAGVLGRDVRGREAVGQKMAVGDLGTCVRGAGC